MVFRDLCVFMLWTNVVSVLEGLSRKDHIVPVFFVVLKKGDTCHNTLRAIVPLLKRQAFSKKHHAKSIAFFLHININAICCDE